VESPVPLVETVDALERHVAPVPVIGLPRIVAPGAAAPAMTRQLGLIS
jgi:hypothetical protein